MKNEKKSLIKQIIGEYSLIHWPKKSEVFQVTIVVLLITLFISIMIFAFDFTFVNVMNTFSSFVKSIIGG